MPTPGHVRRNVTAVIQHQGPLQTQRQVSRDLVTMREELFTGVVVKDPAKLADALQRQARELQEATAGTRSLPVLGGAYYVQAKFPDVGSTLTIVHGLQQEVSWITSRPRPNFAVRQNSTAYNQNQYVVPAVDNGFYYSCFLPGTTDVSPPTYTLYTGQTIVDNGVTWLCMGPIEPVLSEVSQDAKNGRIVIRASNPCTVDIWFFPQPSPQGT